MDSSSSNADADLMGIGQQCALPDCSQLDFLPFTCDCCKRIYCLQHRTYAAHACPLASSGDSTVFVCPLCAKAVKIAEGQDPNVAFEQHTQQGCDPSNYAKVHKKPKCPVPGCREKLTSINVYNCKTCRSTVCLKHRFPEDHQCKEKAAAMAQSLGSRGSQVAQGMRQLLGFGSKLAPPAASKPAAKQTSAAHKAPQQPPAVPARQTPAATAAQQRAAQRGAPAGTAPRTGQEVCPQCSERFGSLQELIYHSEVFHSAPPAAVEACPHCGQAFGDPVALVAHVERQHADSKTACVLC